MGFLFQQRKAVTISEKCSCEEVHWIQRFSSSFLKPFLPLMPFPFVVCLGLHWSSPFSIINGFEYVIAASKWNEATIFNVVLFQLLLFFQRNSTIYYLLTVFVLFVRLFSTIYEMECIGIVRVLCKITCLTNRTDCTNNTKPQGERFTALETTTNKSRNSI